MRIVQDVATYSSFEPCAQRCNANEDAAKRGYVQRLAVGAYPLDEMATKRLYILVPFYIMRYEDAVGRHGGSVFVGACGDVARAIMAAAATDELTVAERDELLKLCVQVSDFLLRDDKILAGKAREAMGGEVYELWSEMKERLEGEIKDLEGNRERLLSENANLLGENDALRREAAEARASERARIVEQLRNAGVDESLVAAIESVA